jgi:hypothetical protein
MAEGWRWIELGLGATHSPYDILMSLLVRALRKNGEVERLADGALERILGHPDLEEAAVGRPPSQTSFPGRRIRPAGIATSVIMEDRTTSIGDTS